MEQAVVGGGCYWCLDAFYRRIRGVSQVESGYSGGHTEHPTMRQVYAGNTGHAEVVRVTFDPSIVTYRELLEIFFVMHDPTTLNRQGHDVGDEYRSVIFYTSDAQQQTAQDVIANFASDLYKDPVVTQLVPLAAFWAADETNQDYYTKNPYAGYCLAVIEPKVQKLRKAFADKYLDKAA